MKQFQESNQFLKVYLNENNFEDIMKVEQKSSVPERKEQLGATAEMLRSVAQDWDQLATKVAKPVLIVKAPVASAPREEVKVEEDAVEEVVDDGKLVFEKARE